MTVDFLKNELLQISELNISTGQDLFTVFPNMNMSFLHQITKNLTQMLILL